MSGVAVGCLMIAGVVPVTHGSTISPTGGAGKIHSVIRAACARYVSAIPESVELAYGLGAYINGSSSFLHRVHPVKNVIPNQVTTTSALSI